MKHIITMLMFVAVVAIASVGRAEDVASKEPFMGVYAWGQPGIARGYLDQFSDWLNRPAVWAVEFQPTDTWDNIEGAVWQLRPWREWVHAKPGRRLVLSVVLLPSGANGPAKGIDKGIPVSLDEGAKGTYNAHFRRLAENLVKYELQDSVLRLGWEFNGGWYTYRAVKKESEFVEYWRQIVKTMREVPGAEKLTFCWNPTNNFVQTDARKCWPGDEFVDYVGVDVYDQSWQPDTYPFPAEASPEDIQKRRELAWSAWIFDKERHGLAMWSEFAKEHHKPLVLPEWGVCTRKDGHGGDDNVYFVEQMTKFIDDPANNVYFHCYFNVNAADGAHQLTTYNGAPTHFPNAATAFKKHFGAMPPATQPSSANTRK